MQEDCPVRVKICGITTVEDAIMAAGAGADAIGFVFHEKSPRYIGPPEVRDIVMKLPPFITTVGVFVNEDLGRVREIASEAGLGAVQLHGAETPTYCASMGISVIKAFRVRGEEDLEALGSYEGKVSAFLLDTYKKGLMGGTGETFDWNLALKASKREIKGALKPTPLIISGGLKPHNVAMAVKKVRPYAVDVSSGVESGPGRKDRDKVLRFIREAKGLHSP